MAKKSSFMVGFEQLAMLFLLAQEEGAPQENPTMLFVMLALFFGIFYLLVLRPQHREESARRDMLSEIKKNDWVVTTGGIFGYVVSIKDNEVVLRVDEEKKVKLRVLKSAIVSISKDEPSKENSENE